MYQDYQDDKEITISDLIWYVIEHWMIIAIATAVCLVIGIGFAFVQKIHADKSAETVVYETEDYSSAASTASNKLDELYAQLSDSDKEALTHYQRYKKMYDEWNSFDNTDVRMQMNANDVYFNKFMFTISTDSVSSAPVIALAYKYAIDMEGSFANIVSSEVNGQQDSSDNSETSSYGKQSILYVTVIGKTEDEVDKTTYDVETLLGDSYSSISSVYGNHKTKIIENDTYIASSSDVINFQNNCEQNIYNMYNNMINAKNALSEDALSYVEAYEDFEQMEKLETEEINGVEPTELELEEKTSTPLSKKIIVIFVALGFIGSCGVIFLLYVLSDRIHLNDDYAYFEGKYGTPVLCKAVDNTKLSYTDKYRYKSVAKIDYDTSLSLTAQSIKNMCAKKQINTIYATGTLMGDAEKQFCTKLANILNAENIILNIVTPIIFNAQTNDTTNMQNVLLIEQAEHSCESDIDVEVHYCKQAGIDIVGIVLVL